MERNITSTIKFTKANITTCNFASKAFEQHDIILNGVYENTTDIMNAYNKANPANICGMVNSFEVREEKRAMPESTFLTYARKVTKRENGEYIYRTIKSNLYQISVFNNYTGQIERHNKPSKDELNKFTARKAFKELETDTLSIVGIALINTIEQGYSISISTFVNYSEVITE